MDLGDGYILTHCSDGWPFARIDCAMLPDKPPSLGFTLYLRRGHEHGASELLIGVAGFYDTAGPWLIAEHLVIVDHPNTTPRERVEGIKRVIPQAISLATAMGKRLMFMNTSKGMEMILRNMGVLSNDGIKLLTTDITLY